MPALADPRHTFFLDLSSNPLRDAGLRRLAESPLLRSVHGLNLNSCQVSDEGLWALSESPHAVNLRELYRPTDLHQRKLQTDLRQHHLPDWLLPRWRLCVGQPRLSLRQWRGLLPSLCSRVSALRAAVVR